MITGLTFLSHFHQKKYLHEKYFAVKALKINVK
jgi:hypothetical protein